VRDVEVQNGGTNDSGESVIGRPVMRHMRVLRHCDGPLLEAILEQPDFELEELHVAWFGSRRRGYDSTKPWKALLSGKGLPKLRRLQLGSDFDFEVERFRDLVMSPLAKRLEMLALTELWERVLEPSIEVLKAAPPAVKLELRVGDPVLLARWRGTRLASLQLQRGMGPPALVMRRGASGAYERV
jgi:hypothetical protein